MKFFLFSLLCIITLSTQAQDFQKWISTGNIEKLQAWYEKGGNFETYMGIEFFMQSPGESAWIYFEMHPMVYAVAKNQHAIAEFYLSHENEMIEAGVWDDAVSQAFIVSISSKNENFATKLYALQPDLEVTCEPCRNASALFVAAAYASEKWFFELADKSSLSIRNDNGAHLLHAAVEGGSLPIIQYLIEHDFSLDGEDNYGRNALDYAIMDSNMLTFQYLYSLKAPASDQIWYSLATGGNFEIYSLIKDSLNKNDLQFSNENNQWPLNYAVNYNYTKIVIDMVSIMKEEIAASDFMYFDGTIMDFADVHILYLTILNENKITYEAILDLCHFVNVGNEDPEYIRFNEFYRKKAIKVFGKDFVEEMDEKYAVSWY
ncbi:MAG: ankyrin repeat domain-containing protein [Crocinitomicaceae bacterium]|nr:ankyrin repeat domain-containing protein [Crocinitomicaceae bacterium]MBK8927052.1 ankyrin repeat domain-containing protein [Crocinitomicaceae bacterium]